MTGTVRASDDDDARLDATVGALELPTSARLMEANHTVTQLLLNGTVVEGDPEAYGGKGQTSAT